MAILRRALGLWTPVVRRLWPWLVFAIGSKELVLYYCGLVTDPSNDTDRILVALISMCVQVGFAVMTSVFTMSVADDLINGKHSDIFGSFRNHFKYLTIESLRTILPVLLKSLLFIIPGILEYLRLSMVLFIVMLDPEYQAGKVDALDRSREITKGRLSFVFLFLMLSAAFELFSTALQSQKLALSPFTYCGLFALSLAGTGYANVLFFCVYENLVQKKR